MSRDPEYSRAWRASRTPEQLEAEKRRNAERMKRWRAANPETARKHAADWRKANPERLRLIRAKSQHGITAERYRAMLVAQNNACAICRREFMRTPDIDHDHATGEVRGLLCNPCNTTLGKMGDTVEGVSTKAAAMITYLKGPQ